MVSCRSAMILTDTQGRIIHLNQAWNQLTGYTLQDVEGKTCQLLHGQDTEVGNIMECKKALSQFADTPPHTATTTADAASSSCAFQMIVTNYHKTGKSFLNHVIIVPIYGGLMSQNLTHY